jgi:hypothetical protein
MRRPWIPLEKPGFMPATGQHARQNANLFRGLAVCGHALLSRLPNRASKVKPFLRFSSTSRIRAISASLHRSSTILVTAAMTVCTHQAGSMRSFAISTKGRRMLFIRFVNRAVQAVWRSHPEGRQQARNSGHSPFRGPARGRSPRARISKFRFSSACGLQAALISLVVEIAVIAPASI